MLTATSDTNGMAGRELRWFRIFFLVSALWNFIGSVPGLLDSAGMFEREFGRALLDPVLVAVYRGAWGTAFIYGFGFLMVAYNPIRHSGVVMMGGIGKALFALNLLLMYLNGWTSDFAVVVILGDVVFVLVFAAYFVRLRHHGHGLV